MFRQTSAFIKPNFMKSRSFGSLVSSSELKAALNKPSPVKVLDGSWHMPNTNRDPYKEFLQKRIAGSQFFGIDTIKDTTTDLPHMLPTPEDFANAVGKLGISQDDHVVVYDTAGVFSACRVYWTFKAFGHDAVSVLNGGLPGWDGPVESGEPTVEAKVYKVPSLQHDLVRDYAAVLKNARQGGVTQVLDARPYPRFTGEAPEPREGLSSGHMPGSISLPFNEVVKEGHMLSDEQLKQVFESKGIDLSKEIIASCGSGITASILYLALERAGAKHLAVYDGSWTEYAAKEDAIIVKA